MRDEEKTKEQLLIELSELRRKITELEDIKQDMEMRSYSEYAKPIIHYAPNPGIKPKSSKKYDVSELIDIPLFQQLFDSFYELTGIMHAMLDTDNNIITSTGWEDICTKFHRCCLQTESRCKQSDSYIKVNNLPIKTSISLGWAIKNHAAQDIREIIKEAEDKMYRNKLLESRSARSTFLVSLERTLWTRSHETKEHCQRMQEIAQKIGQAINLSDSELDNLKLLAVLHDIGKIAIPNSILDKPGKLSPDEWETIKKHPEIGYRIALSSPEMAPIAEAILYHHERWDGAGYPLKLKGEHIPLISRIIAIADTYDVMINGRPYQKAFTKEEVCAEIERCAGTQFDPNLACQAAKLFSEL